MNIEEFHAYCLSKKGVEETLPFGPDTLVFKVMGKMFALTGLEREDFTRLKLVQGKKEEEQAKLAKEAKAKPAKTSSGKENETDITAAFDASDDADVVF